MPTKFKWNAYRDPTIHGWIVQLRTIFAGRKFVVSYRLDPFRMDHPTSKPKYIRHVKQRMHARLINDMEESFQ